MIYVAWALPTLVVLLALASGRCSAIAAAALGLIVTVPVAWFTGPDPYGLSDTVTSVLRGTWVAATLAPYIVGGLLFWKIGSKSFSTNAGSADAEPMPASTVASKREQRRRAFFASFLVGPLAESATGFGVGMVGTVSLLRSLPISPQHLMAFAFLSQTMIPWGAMGSGTLLAAAFSRLPAEVLGLYSMVPITALMVVWLPFYWSLCKRAGLDAPLTEKISEALWCAVAMATLGCATWYLGLEVAMLAAFGSLIVARWWIDWQPSRRIAGQTARKVLPYVILIVGLVVVRVVPELRSGLINLIKIAPFADLPSYSPLFHAGSWLLVGAVMTAMIRGQGNELPSELRQACNTAKAPVLTMVFFASMAEVFVASGIGRAVADVMAQSLRGGAILLTPLIAGGFGILTNSGNAANSLFMPSLVSLAVQSGMSVAAVAALQHVSGAAMTMFSPVRMSIATSLAKSPGAERAVYRTLLAPAAACFVLFFGLAVLLLVLSTTP